MGGGAIAGLAAAGSAGRGAALGGDMTLAGELPRWGEVLPWLRWGEPERLYLRSRGAWWRGVVGCKGGREGWRHWLARLSAHGGELRGSAL